MRTPKCGPKSTRLPCVSPVGCHPELFEHRCHSPAAILTPYCSKSYWATSTFLPARAILSFSAVSIGSTVRSRGTDRARRHLSRDPRSIARPSAGLGRNDRGLPRHRPGPGGRRPGLRTLPGLSRISPRPAGRAIGRVAMAAILSRSGLRSGPAGRRPLGRERADRHPSPTRLDDFIGHRPVAVLRTPRKIEPYEHEWVRPIPLYIRGVGVGTGRYERLIVGGAGNPPQDQRPGHVGSLVRLGHARRAGHRSAAVRFRSPGEQTPQLSFRPVGSPPHGRARALPALRPAANHARCPFGPAPAPGILDADELWFEAAAVLAGTILMASGTSGSGPDTHGSATTLGTLVQQIAAYRDVYYEQLLASTAGKHGERLRSEAANRRQPLAGARQHLNHYLARRRAAQLEHVHLALLFAAMGYADAARRQADIVPTAAARMRCQIGCQIAAHGWPSIAASSSRRRTSC